MHPPSIWIVKSLHNVGKLLTALSMWSLYNYQTIQWQGFPCGEEFAWHLPHGVSQKMACTVCAIDCCLLSSLCGKLSNYYFHHSLLSVTSVTPVWIPGVQTVSAVSEIVNIEANIWICVWHLTTCLLKGTAHAVTLLDLH